MRAYQHPGAFSLFIIALPSSSTIFVGGGIQHCPSGTNMQRVEKRRRKGRILICFKKSPNLRILIGHSKLGMSFSIQSGCVGVGGEPVVPRTNIQKGGHIPTVKFASSSHRFSRFRDSPHWGKYTISVGSQMSQLQSSEWLYRSSSD